MKKILSLLLTVCIVFSLITIIVFAADTSFTLVVSGPDNYLNRKNIDIVFTVNNITLTDGMSYVSFRLYYDVTKVKPIIKDGFTGETENRTTFITNCPDSDTWEVIGLLDETTGYYELTFGTENVSGTKAATADGDLIFTIPFTIIGGTSDDIIFTVPEEYVEGGNKDLSEIEVAGMANDVIIPCYTTTSEESEVSVESEVSDESGDESEEINPFELVDNAPVNISEGFLYGITDKMSIAQIQAMFKRTVTVSGLGTGATITAGNQTIIIIMKGDISGNGKIDSKDYLFAKRAFLRTYTLSTTQLKAACLEDTVLPTAKDYLKIKRHFLGTFDIFTINNV